MLFADLMMLDQSTKRTADGYLLASPKVARTGIQEYLGSELGRPDLAIVKVYRPEKEVFSRDALHSFAHRPVTIDHPPVMVDASNWKKYGVGTIGDEVVRDGEFVRVPLMLMDQNAIAQVEGGKGELSMGYTADLIFEAGVTDSGEKYDAYQANIRGNHLAIVDKARGGSELRVIDSNYRSIPNSQTGDNSVITKKIIVDGVTVEIPDTAAQLIEKSLNDAATKVTTLQTVVSDLQGKEATLATQVATKDGEIATLKAQLADAKNPAAIDAAVKARAAVVDAAKKILPAVVVDAKSDVEIKRQVVDSKMGEVSKAWNDEQIAASFLALTMVAPVADPYASAVRDSSNVNMSDSEKALQERDKAISEAYKNK
jgi:hypothetical protein